MSINKNEKRIRATVAQQNEEELKVLCHELLLEARAHELASIEFDFWLQVFNIARKKGPPAKEIPTWRCSPEYVARHGGVPLHNPDIEAIVGCICGWEGSMRSLKDEACPVCSKAFAPFPFTARQSNPETHTPTDPKQNNSTGIAWAFVVFGIFCGVFASAIVFNI